MGALEEHGFAAALTEEELAALRSHGRTRRFRRGETIFSEGGSSDHVVLVASGRLKISSYTHDGREAVLAVRGPGDLIGELSALDGEPRMASVAALEAAEALLVPAVEFRAFLARYPRVAILLLETLAGRLRDAERKRVEFSAHDTTGRVALRIVELAERFGSPDGRIDLPLTQDELAGWTGSSREAVAKALRALRDRGWIETGRRAIVVHDIDALRRRAT